MFDALRRQILHWMRVPHDPEPPIGASGSVKIFRAGRNYYYVRLIRWGLGQAGALAGILFSVGFLMKFQADVDAAHLARDERARAAAIAATQPAPAVAAPTETAPPTKSRRARGNRGDGYRRLTERTPQWVLPLLKLLELGGIVAFLVQIPVTFAAARLDWELRWYIVTDRSLRIRAGLVSLQESTMSFANLQQVEVRQGPLQRLLGIADLRVQSAGGGGGGQHKGHEMTDSLHTGVFQGVENAHEIRDLILERLRHFREAGLGDPEDRHAHAGEPGSPAESASSADTLAAAQELLAEARALRSTLG